MPNGSSCIVFQLDTSMVANSQEGSRIPPAKVGLGIVFFPAPDHISFPITERRSLGEYIYIYGQAHKGALKNLKSIGFMIIGLLK